MIFTINSKFIMFAVPGTDVLKGRWNMRSNNCMWTLGIYFHQTAHSGQVTSATRKKEQNEIGTAHSHTNISLPRQFIDTCSPQIVPPVSNQPATLNESECVERKCCLCLSFVIIYWKLACFSSLLKSFGEVGSGFLLDGPDPTLGGRFLCFLKLSFSSLGGFCMTSLVIG